MILILILIDFNFVEQQVKVSPTVEFLWGFFRHYKDPLVVAEQLIALISAAKQHNILFIYAISPGLDITFSNPREVATLKKKLDQVGPRHLPAFPTQLCT